MQRDLKGQFTGITGMKVNESRDPVGIDRTPTFSWHALTTGHGVFQSAYQITVSSTEEMAKKGEGDLWDSGRIVSSVCCGVTYKGRALRSHRRYYWGVRIWSADGLSAYRLSDFVTGILSPGEWTGEWIGIDRDISERSGVYLRKEQVLRNGIENAFVSVAGLGYFYLKINGMPADDTYLNCCNTQYNKTVPYRTFDVTKLVKSGANAISVELGNGFYNEQGGVWNWENAAWRDSPKMKLQMTVLYADGSSESFASGSDWRATDRGPIIFNSVYYGESFDARRELNGYSSVGYDDSKWRTSDKMKPPEGRLVCRTGDHVKKVGKFQISDIRKLNDGSYVLVAPKMLTGWAKIDFRCNYEGQKITLLYGEKISSEGNVQKLGGADGENSSWWPERPNMTDEYIARGDACESYEPRFSYKGFRYIQIFGFEGTLTKDDVTLYRVASDVGVSGSFECSDELVNSLHRMAVRTMKNNMHGKPTDTPVWEKNGWLGDLNVALETFTYNFDCSNFLPDFIAVMQDCFEEYGILPQMVPTAGWGVTEQYVWNSVLVFSVYELYRVYGMKSFMQEKYALLSAYAESIIGKMRKSSWIAPDTQLGDWVSPMNSRDARYCESPNEGSGIVATAYVYKMVTVMADIARTLGHEEDAVKYESAAQNILTAFNGRFYNEQSGFYETGVWRACGEKRTAYRQTSQLVPLAFGMVPKDNVQRVVDSLIGDIVSKDYHLDTGCVGTREILQVLTRCGYPGVAYKILTRRTYPSWGFMTEQGADSLWEMWETTTRSRAHYFLGTYDMWLYSCLAGITDISQGYESYTVNPFVPDDLSFVSCTLKTVRGELESSWKKETDGSLRMKLTVPPGSKATVYFPTKRTENIRVFGQEAPMCKIIPGTKETNACACLTGGSYEFVSRSDAPFCPVSGRIRVKVNDDLPPMKEQ